MISQASPYCSFRYARHLLQDVSLSCQKVIVKVGFTLEKYLSSTRRESLNI